MAANPNVFFIPAEVSFVDALAQGILHRYGGDPLSLPRARILLPTRRGTRALQEAFLRASGGRSMILPAIQAIGDPDEEEVLLGGVTSQAESQGLLPPAIPPLRRLMLLSELVTQWQKTAAAQGYSDPANAFYLALELGRLIDQVQTEGCNFDDLEKLVPEDFAAHWQVTVRFLDIVTTHWPRILDDHGFMDAAERRNVLLGRLAELWRQAPPAGPVIAAGSTGSIPATAELLKTIAHLPNGSVVLPGLDVEMDEDSWAQLGPTHPQFGMAQLLGHMQIDYAEVKPWPHIPLPSASASARRRLINESMRPAQTTGVWQQRKIPAEDALKGLTRIDAPTLQAEAGAIALIMRQTLETPGKTAALVTADRRLARHVTAQMKRWDITLDDSAGQPLAKQPTGSFMRLVAHMLAEKAAPIPLLSVLKHSHCAAQMEPAALRRTVAALERSALRGARPAPGFDGLINVLSDGVLSDGALSDSGADKELTSFIKRLKGWSAEFSKLMSQANAPLGKLLKAHIALCEELAATKDIAQDKSGAERLWTGESGEATANFLTAFLEAAEGRSPIAGGAYASLFEAALGGEVVRSRWNTHPRLFIWGPLEARLQHVDVMILGGLNEGVWPPDPGTDPWMSRPMKTKLGLSLPERRIGLSAHDFVQAACAGEVILTRAERVDGTPTLPARWLLRLESLSGGLEKVQTPYTKWAAALDRPDAVKPCDAPAPTPPVSARPRRLSVTEVETWMRDPYALYARKILGLRALDPIDEDPSAREYGTFVHQALEGFVDRFGAGVPDDGFDQLRTLGEDAFKAFLHRPTVRAFWWPRFLQIAQWFLAAQSARAGTAQPAGVEITGEMNIPGKEGPFTLRAKADRIDALSGGGFEIIDYKTGVIPRVRRISAGYAPQLPLEAAILQAGGFETIPDGTVTELSYWALKGGATGSRIAPVSHMKGAPAMDELISDAAAGLERIVAAFDKAETPYRSHPNPVEAGWGDYDHLARTDEWGQVD